MALNFAKNNLANNLGVANQPLGVVPNAGTLWEIRKYSESALTLLLHLAAADPHVAQPSSQRMLEVLAWLSMTVFPNALARFPPGVQGLVGGPWTDASNARNNLNVNVLAAAALHQPNPLVLNAGANVAVESALELLYETVLEGIPAPQTFLLGWAALSAIQLPALPPPPIGGVARGLPQVGMLCFGNAAPAGIPRFVVSCCFSQWDRFAEMQVWANNARQLYIPPAYSGDVTNVSNRLHAMGGFAGAVPPAQDLQLAWNNNVAAGGQDAALAATWTTICNLAPAVAAPRTYTRNIPAFEALSFDTFNVAAKARCRRCRVMFLYNMSALEPQVYNAGPYPNRISCAEVTAYQKCLTHGL